MTELNSNEKTNGQINVQIISEKQLGCTVSQLGQAHTKYGGINIKTKEKL